MAATHEINDIEDIRVDDDASVFFRRWPHTFNLDQCTLIGFGTGLPATEVIAKGDQRKREIDAWLAEHKVVYGRFYGYIGFDNPNVAFEFRLRWM